MQQAVADGEGAMAAIIGLDDDQVVSVCAEAAENGVAEAVNFNSPSQVVIAGDTAAIDRAIEQLKVAGAKRAIKLAVSVPSHCSLMSGASQQLAEKLSGISLSDSSVPVLHNINASSVDNADDVKIALSEQLFKPVRWVDTINNLKNDLGAQSIIEFGPGKILFGLNRRIDRKLGNVCINDSASLEKALALCNA